jgi:hypothetical protein
MHHPPLPLGNAQMDPIACENGHRRWRWLSVSRR